jgi:hypothetical protein
MPLFIVGLVWNESERKAAADRDKLNSNKKDRVEGQKSE